MASRKLKGVSRNALKWTEMTPNMARYINQDWGEAPPETSPPLTEIEFFCAGNKDRLKHLKRLHRQLSISNKFKSLSVERQELTVLYIYKLCLVLRIEPNARHAVRIWNSFLIGGNKL